MKILGKLLIAFLSFTTVAVSSAQSHPNFTGTWKLNVQRSDTSSTGITALVVDVVHKDPAFTYTAKGTQEGQSFEETETFTPMESLLTILTARPSNRTGTVKR